MRALSIRQPYAELILRGIKTAELRSRPTRIIGQRFHIYASLKRASVEELRVWSRDLAMPDDRLPGWMLELAEQMKLIPPGLELPTGVIVGSAVIERCEEVGGQGSEVRDQKSDGASLSSLSSDLRPLTSRSDLRPLTSIYAWHLADVRRHKILRQPKRHPQPSWFRPF
jgi:hypothetical protein